MEVLEAVEPEALMTDKSSILGRKRKNIPQFLAKIYDILEVNSKIPFFLKLLRMIYIRISFAGLQMENTSF